MGLKEGTQGEEKEKTTKKLFVKPKGEKETFTGRGGKESALEGEKRKGGAADN